MQPQVLGRQLAAKPLACNEGYHVMLQDQWMLRFKGDDEGGGYQASAEEEPNCDSSAC